MRGTERRCLNLKKTLLAASFRFSLSCVNVLSYLFCAIRRLLLCFWTVFRSLQRWTLAVLSGLEIAFLFDPCFRFLDTVIARRRVMMADEPVAGPSSAEPSAGPSSTQRDPPPVRNDEFTEDGEYVNRTLNKDEVLNHMNLTRLTRNLGTKEQCVAYSEEQGLVKTEMRCPVHRTSMKISYASCKKLGSFVCSKGTCCQRGNRRVSRSVGTFFGDVKITLQMMYYLIYAFASNWSLDQTQHEDPYRDDNQTCLSYRTICDWNSYCREVIVIYFMEKMNNYTGKIGGPGKIVQIDESKFGKRKYNKGILFL